MTGIACYQWLIFQALKSKLILSIYQELILFSCKSTKYIFLLSNCTVLNKTIRNYFILGQLFHQLRNYCFFLQENYGCEGIFPIFIG
jgi:hypothetical protein